MRWRKVALIVMIAYAFVFAEQTTRPADPAKRIRGVLTRVEGTTLIIRPGGRSLMPGAESSQSPVSVPTDEHTQVRIDGNPAQVSDLKSGMTVDYTPIPARGERPAMVMLMANSPTIDGIVVRLEDKAIVLHVTAGDGDGKESRFETNDATRVSFVSVGRRTPGRHATVDELKAGTRIKVIASDGVAVVIYAVPAEVYPASQPSK